eukprot:TRINITY_DN25426_c0_g1_i1.p1 TRINITY_DN25426_c0_g1~~TRINITY_DN25426_c0_g1_i1.p1  ORF type:complete len:181 (+),score=26.47 TRINITY_DN25426_c0_g1_i1:69-611(+)
MEVAATVAGVTLLGALWSRRKRGTVERAPTNVVLILQDGNERDADKIGWVVGRLKDFGVEKVSLYHTEKGVLEKILPSEVKSQVHKLLDITDGRKQFNSFVSEHHPTSEEEISASLPPFTASDEPNLILVFGLSRCIYGFPPWHIPVTEFEFHDSLPKYTESDLKSDLVHYSNTKVVKGV